jgi:hypothetical protein
MKNFSEVGGLSADQLNRRFTVYSRLSDQQFFLTTPENMIATSFTRGGLSGSVDICTIPVTPLIAGLINNFARSTCPPIPNTLFFSETPNSVSSYSRVIISGLDGDYKKLNGEHEANPLNFERFNCNNNKEIWKEGYYSPNRKHYFSLKVETSGLPSFNPAIHTVNGKNFKIERIIPHLTDDSGYGDFADACFYLFWKQGMNTHAFARFYLDLIEGTRNPSWERIQHQISNFQTFL